MVDFRITGRHGELISVWANDLKLHERHPLPAQSRGRSATLDALHTGTPVPTMKSSPMLPLPKSCPTPIASSPSRVPVQGEAGPPAASAIQGSIAPNTAADYENMSDCRDRFD